MTDTIIKTTIRVEDQWGDTIIIPVGARVEIGKAQDETQELVYNGISYFLPQSLLLTALR